MKFTKVNIESPKGRQPSAYDELASEFSKPGDALQFDERSVDPVDGMSRQTASNVAKRLMLITGFQFHSFYDVTTKKVTIRRRMAGEVPAKNESSDDDDDVELPDTEPAKENVVDFTSEEERLNSLFK